MEETMIIHKAKSRGQVDFGWLQSKHTFSFGSYRNEQRINFGALRVLNDDTVSPGMGFAKHPHQNMEIISIPLSGDLHHKDSIGNESIINQGDIQVMSAGTGIEHSEKNKNKDQEVKFLQIWLIPNKKNVMPRYDQKSMSDFAAKNEWYQILSPNPNDQGVWVHQNAWFHMGEFDQNKEISYRLKDNENLLYVFVLKGTVGIQDQIFGERDGIGLIQGDNHSFKVEKNTKLLLMEVPAI